MYALFAWVPVCFLSLVFVGVWVTDVTAGISHLTDHKSSCI